MLVIGITGTIGSGKSTVAGFLRDLGAKVIDADEVGHEVYLPGSPGWKAVVAAFGGSIIAADGTVDRHKLGEIVFKNPADLDRLNRVMRPLIFAEVLAHLKKFRQKRTRVVVLEAALLIEAGWGPLVDEIWVTVAPESVIYKRLGAKRELNREQIQSRIKAQLPVTAQLKCASRIIDTDVSLPELKAKIASIWQELKK
jgi:dephospho-CoA kinase